MTLMVEKGRSSKTSTLFLSGKLLVTMRYDVASIFGDFAASHSLLRTRPLEFDLK